MTAVDPKETVVEEALVTVEEHHPGEIIWVQHAPRPWHRADSDGSNARVWVPPALRRRHSVGVTECNMDALTAFQAVYGAMLLFVVAAV